MKIHKKIILLSSLICCANGFIGYELYKSNQKMIRSETWVRHTEEVISELASLDVMIKDMEIARLSDSGTIPGPLNKEIIAYKHIETISNLTTDNLYQRPNIDSLDFNVHHYFKWYQQFGNKRYYYRDRVNAIIKGIRLKEQELLIQRKNRNVHSIASIKIFSMVMYLVMTFFIIMLLVSIGKYLFRVKKKIKREAALIIINKQLADLNSEKEKRASELIVANEELAFQNKEKENRASELTIANQELAIQNSEKEKRAAELVIANEELAFQNKEKENRASELTIANQELAIQNCEKEKRAAELIIANKELAFQNKEKESRASELTIANKELAIQNLEKEKRANELILVNQNLEVAKEQQKQHINGLEEMMFMTSHRVRQPVANIMGLTLLLRESETEEEQELLVDGLEKSAAHLDTFTKEFTVLLNNLHERAKTDEEI